MYYSTLYRLQRFNKSRGGGLVLGGGGKRGFWLN